MWPLLPPITQWAHKLGYSYKSDLSKYQRCFRSFSCDVNVCLITGSKEEISRVSKEDEHRGLECYGGMSTMLFISIDVQVLVRQNWRMLVSSGLFFVNVPCSAKNKSAKTVQVYLFFWCNHPTITKHLPQDHLRHAAYDIVRTRCKQAHPSRFAATA